MTAAAKTEERSKAAAAAPREVLVEMVKFAQKNGLKGTRGGWKEFLESHDKKLGAGLSDPARRSAEVLNAFLETFTQEKESKLLRKMMRRRSDRQAMEQFVRECPELETPEQNLVRLTLEHPQYIQRYSFPSLDEEWVIISLGKISKAMTSRKLISVDCEMVLCEDGTNAAVKVCAVDHNLEVKLDKVIKPNKAVTNYRSDITGVTAKDLEGVTCSLDDVQKLLKKLLSHGTILVGHSLHNDLKVLKIDYPRIIDTAHIFNLEDLPDTYSPSLNSLCKSVLNYELRKEGEPHNCLRDAEAAMKLALAKLEHGLNDPIAIERKTVSESDLAKLLLHKIPVDLPFQELRSVFSAEHNIDIEADVNARGQFYSTCAVFKDAGEADAAFRAIKGQETKDSSGRQQKLVSLKLGSGVTFGFYIRRMSADNPSTDAGSAKKRVPPEDGSQNPKRQKMGSYECDHIKEIEKLKQDLRDREKEIFDLQKLVSDLNKGL